jgi:exodeoxyribonuclease VII small subunit
MQYATTGGFMTFEEAYTELEQIVAQMEGGTPTLDEAIALYERGVTLSRHCSTLLEKAELRVNRLRDDADGSVTEEPFDG